MNKQERGLTPEMERKTMNAFREFINFSNDLLKQGLMFEKKVAKFSNTSAAIYLPKRLIGRKFKVFLMPVDDGYEISDPTIEAAKIPEMKKADKILRDAEKDLRAIQEDSKMIDTQVKPMAPIL